MSNVVVITTSLRNRSNSDILAERLIKGAEEAGNQVEHISLKDKKLNFCIGCLSCQKTQKCVLKDDEYSLSKSQVYYSIDAKVKVKPLMLDTSYVLSYIGDASDRMDSWNTITYSTTRGY